MRALRLLLLAASTVLPISLLAQTPTPDAAKSVIRNGSFESALQTSNLWEGTDREGFLSGFPYSAAILNRQGSIQDARMPLSVALGDLNGDGLLDIVSSDPIGYIRIYFNSGTKAAPTFTIGELTLPFLALGEGDPPWAPSSVEARDWRELWNNRRKVPKVSLVDSTRSGKLDIVVGNYFGDLFLIRNSGSTTVPRFDQPVPLSRGMIQTSKDPTRRWGNIFAPLLHDWDGDGRPDLLVGEGSFSANNIHLFLNQGSANAPVFNEEKRQPLALGQGREQLNPTMADFNGDGQPDILVSDNAGHVTVYLRPANWKAGDTINPAGYIAKEGGLTTSTPDDPAKEKAQALALGSGINTIAAGDLNGDGLFDLVVGKSSGRIAWAPNTGTKDKPKFAPPSDITGSKPTPATWMMPLQWDLDTGIGRGNFYAYATVVTDADDPGASPPEGTKALKFGYAKLVNPRLPRALLSYPALPSFSREGRDQHEMLVHEPTATQRSIGAPPNFFVMRQKDFVLQIGKTYTLTLNVKGSKVSNAKMIFAWRGFKELEARREVRGERGAVSRVGGSRIRDYAEIIIPFNPTSTWTTVKRTFKVEFQNVKELNKEKETSSATMDISFDLTAPDGVFYIDDIKLTPEG